MDEEHEVQHSKQGSRAQGSGVSRRESTRGNISQCPNFKLLLYGFGTAHGDGGGGGGAVVLGGPQRH